MLVFELLDMRTGAKSYCLTLSQDGPPDSEMPVNNAPPTMTMHVSSVKLIQFKVDGRQGRESWTLLRH